jgi:hypothetical protein
MREWEPRPDTDYDGAAAIHQALRQPSHTRWKHVNVKVTGEGVLFFDGQHGQTGVAKNGMELHPVIGIH